MSSFNSSQVGFFIIGGRSVLGSRTGIDVTVQSPVKDKTPLGVAAVEKAHVGIESAMVSQKGFFDETANAANDAILGAPSRTSQVVSIGMGGNTVGAEAFCLAGTLTGSYKRAIAVEEFTKADAEMESSGAIDDQSKVIAPHTARTGATWTTTGLDNASSSNTGLAAYVQVSALTLGGYTNCVIVLQHSTDNSTWVDLVTFTAVTAAPAAERKTVSSGTTINRYLRASASYTGAGTGQTVTALVCAERY
jgi:hypothetical protein